MRKQGSPGEVKPTTGPLLCWHLLKITTNILNVKRLSGRRLDPPVIDKRPKLDCLRLASPGYDIGMLSPS
jgi:hypothetical protein